MGPMELKALDDNLACIQQNLILTELFYAILIQEGVFTEEMIETVKAQQTNSQKVSQMITLLKRREADKLDKFIMALDTTSNGHVAEVLRTSYDIGKGGQNLKDIFACNKLTINQEMLINAHFVPKESYVTLVNENQKMQEMITKQELNITGNGTMVDRREYDRRIDQKDREYKQLELELDLNVDEMEHMSNVIRKLKQRIINDGDVEDTKERLQSTISENSRLYENLKTVSDELDTTQKQLETVLKQEDKLEQQLMEKDAQLTEMTKKESKLIAEIKASKTALNKKFQNRIQELSSSIKNLKQEKITVQRQLNDVLDEKAVLSTHVKHLERALTRMKRRDRIEEIEDNTSYELKEQSVYPAKQKSIIVPSRVNIAWESKDRLTHRSQTDVGNSTARSSLSSDGTKVCDNQVMLPKIKRKSSPDSSRLTGPTRYCMLCRMEYSVSAGSATDNICCWVHHKALRNETWQCCSRRDKCSNSSGCLQIKHFYIDFVNTEINLTDGQTCVTVGKHI